MCTVNPLIKLINSPDKYSILAKIRQESLDIYGVDLTQQCDKRLVCYSKACSGRQLPWKSPTAKPYLEMLKSTHQVKNDLLFIDNNCNSCVLAKTCKSVCDQNNDFINRDYTAGPAITLRPSMDEIIAPPVDEMGGLLTVAGKDIPWDALSDQKQKVIKTYLYDLRDFKRTAAACDIKNPSYCRYVFYSALTRLSEIAVMRRVLADNSKLTVSDKELLYHLYVDNKSLIDYAKSKGLSKQAASNRLKRLILKSNAKWPVFVKKKHNRIIYNIPEVLK